MDIETAGPDGVPWEAALVSIPWRRVNTAAIRTSIPKAGFENGLSVTGSGSFLFEAKS
jgi:hypothetical protein